MGGCQWGCHNPCQGCCWTNFNNDAAYQAHKKGAVPGLKVQFTHFETQYWPNHHWRVLGMCLLTVKLIASPVAGAPNAACVDEKKQASYDWKQPQHKAHTGCDVVMHIIEKEKAHAHVQCKATSLNLASTMLASKAWYLYGRSGCQLTSLGQRHFKVTLWSSFFETCVTITHSCNCPYIAACLCSKQNPMSLTSFHHGILHGAPTRL